MVEDKSLLLNSVSEMDSEEGDVYAMRINLSVTMVGLVNNTNIHWSQPTELTSFLCMLGEWQYHGGETIQLGERE